MKGDDPVSLFEQDTGVLNTRTPDFFALGYPDIVGGQIYSRSKDFSVYGSDSSWNRYFYGNIQIPSNIHASNPSAAVITRKAVDSVEIYKGSPKGIYGPGLGGTLALTPRRDPDNYLLLGLSPTDPSLTFNFWLSEHFSFFISTRYSTFQYTVLPIIQEYAKNDSNISISTTDLSYADSLLSLRYKKGNHDISIQTLAFYDRWIQKAKITVPFTSSTIEMRNNQMPIFAASGISWKTLLGDSLQNTIATSFSIYNSSADSTSTNYESNKFTNEDSYAGYAQTISYKVLDHFEWFINDSMSLTFGAEFEYLNLKGKHEDRLKYNRGDKIIETIVPSYTIKERIYKAYGFTEHNWNIDKFEITSTLGLTQIILDDEGTNLEYSFPSAREEVAYNISSKWKISLMTSWNPTFLEGSKYIDKRLSEIRVKYNNRSKYNHPTYGITSIPKLTWQINDSHIMFLEGFYTYSYNFSGMTYGLIVNKTSSSYEYLTPTEGMNTGGSLEWQFTPQYHLYSISYTLNFAMYNTDKYGWLPPANDYRHQLKTSYFYSKVKQFQIGIIGAVLFDVPFTPEEMVSSAVDPDPNDTTADDAPLISQHMYPYSARSYIPKYELYLNIKGTIIHGKNWDFTYSIQPGNILSLFEMSGDQIEDNTYIGANNKDVNNRTFLLDFEPTTPLQDFFLTLEVTIKLPQKNRR